MLTSSRLERRARAKSRRSRGSRRFGMRGIEEAHRGERAPRVRVQRLDLVVRRGREARRAPDVARAGGDAQLVGGDLHGRREIERRDSRRFGGNRRDDAAARELGVRQPGHLGAEHERDVAVRRVRDRLARRVAHRQHAPGELARPRRQADRAARSRRAPRRASRRRARASSTAVAPEAQRDGLGIGKARGRDQHEAREAHREHRARRGADVAGMARAHEHDADARERGAVGCGHGSAVGGTRQNGRIRGYNSASLIATPRPRAPQHHAMHPMLTIAVKAARRAGNIINRGARDLDLLTVTAKGPKDFVSEIDRDAERRSSRRCSSAYPDHAILAEEGTAKGANADAEYVWIIDPLDGTTNFLHGFPQYCVSIALAHKDVVQQGVIYDPVRNDLFTATRGRGAFLNDRRIRVVAPARTCATA